MAAARTPVLRHLLSGSTPRALRASHQRRWAQVHDVRFLATTQAPRNILEKYREKLDQKARAEGHAGIDSLRSAYAGKIDKMRKETDAVTAPLTPTPAESTPESAQPQHQQPSQSRPPKSSSSSSQTGIKPLSKILNLPKALTLPAAELSHIWRLHHASNPLSLTATIPAVTYETMSATARLHPQFLLPVPHPTQGAELHFLQWTWDPPTRSATVLFTQLAEYKARGEFASPHTTVTHYAELAGEKGVVLMQGSVMADRGVGVEDARWLVMCLQRFYGGWESKGEEGRERAEERRKLLEWFGKGDGRFTVERLMEEAERMG
ncbi:ATP11 protein-domain-containing protein [Staphylotrichum tortipilum]|uniref:ATP11 protein-domain-containing protein n=1 Tax=Staphylotrichum tortipilum TaxID=2831512 RepID=A0AAN6MCE0_9PEZI|nr:ATP11 protein-domain-containing protein [Staphylotrichum longicolle]